MPQAQTYQSEFTGLEMDARLTAVAQLTAALEALTTVVAQKYVKPASGIPSTDMDADVQAALAKANTAVQSLADYYTKSEVDQLLAAINGMEYVDVAALPTASASTMGKIYLVGPDASGYYSYYYTSYDGSAYSWVGPLGTTQISLANYATKAELSQLDQEVDTKLDGIEVTNPEWLWVITDGEGKILAGIKPDGAIEWEVGVPTPIQEIVSNLQNQIDAAQNENDSFQLSKQSNNIIDVIGFSSFKEKTMTIIYPDKYSCWPRMGKVGDKLICAYVKALQHDDPQNGTGAIWVSTSANGVVWTPKRLIIDTQNVRDSVTGCGNDGDGNFLLINRVGAPGNVAAYIEIYKTANGIDFEKISTIPASTPLGHVGDIINVPTRGLMAFFGEYGNASAPWGYILSNDNGKTWTKTSVESVVKEARPMEMSGVYLGEGKILVAGRYEGTGDAYMWQMQSEDYGVTWTKQATNISGNAYTPSLIYDEVTGKISLYIYNRGTGKLEYRQVDVADVWGHPTAWPSATIISSGTIGQDAGNVSATAFNGSQFAAYYSGDEADTGIYVTIM